MSPALRAQLREAAEKALPPREQEDPTDYGCMCGACTWCLLCMTYGDPMPVPEQKKARQR